MYLAKVGMYSIGKNINVETVKPNCSGIFQGWIIDIIYSHENKEFSNNTTSKNSFIKA